MAENLPCSWNSQREVLVKPPYLNPLWTGSRSHLSPGWGGPGGLPLFQKCDPVGPKSCSLQAQHILPFPQIFPVSSWQSCWFLCWYQRGVIGKECPCCSCWCSVSTQNLCCLWFLKKILVLLSSWGRKVVEVEFWGLERAGGSFGGTKELESTGVLEMGPPLLAPWWPCVTRQLCH